jgi:hypothetical protein
MDKDVDGPHRVGTQQWSRLAHRRKLPSMVAALGLGQPQAKTDVQNIRGRDRGALYFHSFAEVRDRVIGAGQVDARTVDAASALLNDPNYWTQCWMMTAVLVRKPRA